MKTTGSKLAPAAALALFTCLPGLQGQTVVLNFDDLTGTGPVKGSWDPNDWTYQGFRFGYNVGPRTVDCAYCVGSWYWSDIQSPNFPAFDQPWYSSASTSLSTDYRSFPDGNPADPNWPFTSTNWGESLGITRPEPFNFSGAYFIALDDNTKIQVNGYLGGNLVAQSAMITLNYNDGGAFLNSGFGTQPVDEIRILSRQGFFAMDDFSINEVLIPEPSAALLGGLGSLLLLRRSRRQSA